MVRPYHDEDVNADVDDVDVNDDDGDGVDDDLRRDNGSSPPLYPGPHLSTRARSFPEKG